MGVAIGHFDNDGWADILVANGNFSQLTDSLTHEPRYREPLQVSHPYGDGTYTDVFEQSGLNDAPMQSRRGTAICSATEVVPFQNRIPPDISY